MKKQRLLGLLAVGVAGVALIVTANVNGQSESKPQAGSGTTIQQGSSTQYQECPTVQGNVTAEGSATAQGSATQQGVPAQQATPPAKTFEQKMWSYIKTARYDQWAPAGDDGDFRESERPHGAFVKTYMNRRAAGNSDELPHGSVIIKENFSPEKKLVAITLMHRSKGYNPDANDWYWIKYNADGTTAMMDSPMGKMAVAGKAKGCIECHSGADGDDYAFFND